MGTPTMPPKGVIKARARARVGVLCAMVQVATPSPKAVAAAQRAEQQSAKTGLRSARNTSKQTPYFAGRARVSRISVG